MTYLTISIIREEVKIKIVLGEQDRCLCQSQMQPKSKSPSNVDFSLRCVSSVGEEIQSLRTVAENAEEAS
jgi:hypothetical protein